MALPVAASPTAGDVVAVRLGNGMRLLAARAQGTGVVASCLHLAGGVRAEPVPGLAHLSEHLLCRPEFRRGEHGDAIAGAGGAFSARTAEDYVQFQHVVPDREYLPHLLEAVRRQLAPEEPTEEEVASQVRVIEAEAVRAVRRRPHGGLVTVHLPPLLFQRYANAHDGQTDTSRLAAVDLRDVAAYLRWATRPAAATVAVVGDAPARELAEAARAALDFPAPVAAGDAPDGPHGPVPPREEQEPGRPRAATRVDPLAATSRTAVGFRVPDPHGDPDAYLAVALLAEVVGLVSGVADHTPWAAGAPGPVRARVGRAGNPFDVLAPSLFALERSHPADVPGEAVEAGLRVLLAGTAKEPGQLRPVLTGTVRSLHRRLAAEQESARSRASWMCIGDALHGDPAFLAGLPGRMRGVTVTDIAAAAGALAGAPAARITSEPDGGRRSAR